MPPLDSQDQIDYNQIPPEMAGDDSYSAVPRLVPFSNAFQQSTTSPKQPPPVTRPTIFNQGDPSVSQQYVPPVDESSYNGQVLPSPVGQAAPVQPMQPPAVPAFQAYQQQTIVSQPAPNTQPFAQPPAPAAPQPKKRRGLGRFFVLAAVVVALLAGGSAAAYFTYVLPNQPNTVVQRSIANLLSQPYQGGYIMNVSMKAASTDPSPSAEFAVNGSTDASGNSRMDIDLGASFFRLKAAAILRPKEQALYLKVDELPALLSQVGGGRSPEITALSKKLDKNWMEISTKGLETAGVMNKDQVAEANSCIAALSSFATDQNGTLLRQLAASYQANPFVEAEKQSSEDVDGVAATKYKLTISTNKANDFLRSKLIDTSVIDKACGATSNSTDTATVLDQALNESGQSVRVENGFLWVTKGNKVAKIAGTIIADQLNTDFSLTFNGQLLDASKPSNVVTITELTKLLNGLPGASGSSLLNIKPEEFLSL